MDLVVDTEVFAVKPRNHEAYICGDIFAVQGAAVCQMCFFFWIRILSPAGAPAGMKMMTDSIVNQAFVRA